MDYIWKAMVEKYKKEFIKRGMMKECDHRFGMENYVCPYCDERKDI